MTRLDHLDPAVARAVRDLALRAETEDGIEALGEQTLLQLTGEADVVHLLLDRDAGTEGGSTAAAPLAGYAQLDRGTASAELVVDPGARRAGRGSALLGAVLTEGAATGLADLRVWAHGDLPGAQALAARSGLVVRRELWQMSRPLTEAAGPATATPPGVTPPGVTVRPFVVGQDEQAWLEVNARAFADHPEQGRMTLRDVEARQGEPWFRAEDLLLAEQDGRLVASAWMKVEPGAEDGELYALGVDPAAQGSGLGRHLTALVLAHLRDRGLARATLYVEAENAAAVRTYTRAGFERSRVDVQYG
ncbi:mycothiol synthase [Actinotalea sp. BY-33]|uniref:Mycothiol acetyltransferase n=1 Tax=Actinotalea soli TaxID=2819234 RepID=A0A939LRA9_9CELL|nr:mycothiol synthase [Actinotalea soli]